MCSTYDTTFDLASRRFVVNANLSTCVAEMSNFDTDELGRILANAVSNFLNRPGQNSENERTETRHFGQAKRKHLLKNFGIFIIEVCF